MFGLNPLSAIQGYIYLAVALAFAALLVYCKVLHRENVTLISDKAKLEQSVTGFIKTVERYDAATKELKAKEDERTEAAKAAVEEAKKSSHIDYVASQTLLSRKPKPPIVTPGNANQYGGLTTELKMSDYLAAQDLANEEIDRRQAELAKK
jgi:predicted S18 family serine protease